MVGLAGSTGTAAEDADLQIWYTLDETSGEVAHDDSMYGRDAVVDGPEEGPYWDPCDGRFGGSLLFNDDTVIEVPSSALSTISTGITVSVWLKDAYRLDSSNWVFEAEGSGGAVVQAAVAHMPSEEALWRAGNDSNDVLWWDFDGVDHMEIEGWHLWTFVKDEVEGHISMYFDDRLVESNDVVDNTLVNVKSKQLRFGAGSGHANSFEGKMDDIRVYDVALSADEVQELFRGGVTETAWSPDPQDEAEDICPGASLCWKPGDSAAEHEVYLGTDYDDVNNANTSSSEYEGSQEPNFFSPTLDMGTTYYWRVDEVNEPDRWKGSVWEFTTNDGNAFNPNPADEQTAVSRETVLSWTPGCLATSHKVYFSADFNEVNERQAAADLGEVGPNTIDPCDGLLEYSTYYYWAVDETDGITTWRGTVWSFRAESPIIDVNMVAWYTLDEGEGDTAHDSSGYEHHADVAGPSAGVNWDPNDGHYGGSLAFDDDTTVLCPKAAMSKISNGITVSLWLKDAYRSGSDNWVFDLPGSSGLWVQAAVVEEDNDEVLWQAGNDTNDVLTWDLDGADAEALEGWHHWAFVKCENPPEISIYFDGFVVESNDVVNNTLITVRGQRFRLGVGAGHGNDFVGKMDDVRVFDKALSDKEVASLFRGGNLALAWAPSPGDFAKDVPRDVVLKWQPGDYVVSHDVYLGTEWDDVNDANTSSSVFMDNREPNEYDPPGNLELDTTYYWRIDEVNEADANSPWKGNVWTFTVANFLIVDDMESYCTGFGCTNEIYDTWLDGYAENNNTGSEVVLGIDPIEPVHGGKQSMEYVYDNADTYTIGLDYYSEAEREFADPCDWTEADVKILTLFFYGDPNNDADATEQMYVGLEDSSGAGSYAQINYGFYGENMNDIKKKEWHQWDMAVSDFSGVSANYIKKIYIGFGIRGNPYPDGVPGGSGTMYFDSVRLYLRKCIPWRLKPVADLTDDCRVDLADVGQMADEWLKTDACLPTDPPTPGPVGWWKLDEGSGNTANDSSASGTHDGTITGGASWIAGKIGPYALEFTDGKVLVADAAELRPLTTVSACAWVNYSETPGYSARVVAKGADTGDSESYALQVDDDDTISWFVRDANHGLHSVDGTSKIVHNEWIHLAGTYDGAVLKCYFYGQLDSSKDDANVVALLQDTNDLAIGNRADANTRQFEGGVDDVRVYNRALTDAEVAYIGTEGSGYSPLVSEGNLYNKEPSGSKVINFRDLDVLLDEWLDVKLWPPQE